MGRATGANSAVVQVADPVERIRFLRAEIARHDELYHREARPEISDADYDQLRRELAELEHRFPSEAASLGASPVRGVGDDRRAGWPKHRHGERMLSLEKTTSEAGLREFDQRLRSLVGAAQEFSYVVEPKFDGLAVSVTYEDGTLARIVTRGDGEEGDDVTSAARRIPALPTKLAVPETAAAPQTIEIRGEVYMSLAEFDRINGEREEAGEPGFASPRNLAAGTLKSNERDDRRLEIVFYGLGKVEPSGGPATQRELIAQLGAWGLPTVTNAHRAESIDGAWQAVRELERERSDLAYPIDGAVVKLDSFAARARAGETSSAPRWAIAFKYAPQRVSTRLIGITLQVGRTGRITPVAELDPVELAGATIARATLHNADEIARRDLRVGDYVFVERQGDVIPAITGVDFARRDPSLAAFVLPAECPGCGERLVRAEGEAAWRCDNQACDARLQRRVLHFAGCLGVKGLGEATAEALVRAQSIRSPSGIFTLTREQLVRGAHLSPKSADALLAEIEQAKRAALWRFVHGLSAPGVGRTAAQALARHFGSLEALAAAGEKDLRTVDGIGPGIARNVAAFLAEPIVQAELRLLKEAGVAPTGSSVAIDSLAGKSFVLSGQLPTLSHGRAAELIEAAGGRVSGSVTRRTSYVVAGANAGTKRERAKALGIPVIDEAELLVLLRAGAADQARLATERDLN
jgi:DNA ligase (NAD+)